MRLQFLLSLFLVQLGACSADWQTRDEDGDGTSIAQGDCDDGPDGAAIGPGATEVWYDGIDQNCDGADDFDKDGDGFQSADYGGQDCWDDPDTSPAEMVALNGFPQLAAADVYPGAEGEIFYDGVDADCDGAGEFDRDGDGFDSATWESRQGYGEDCYDDVDDDFDDPAGLGPAAVYPGATDEWYDGTDADCDGASDYDQDGDGFDQDEECDDTDAAVFPDDSIEEIWYNGVDENCDGNDGDKDDDGYLIEGYDGPPHPGRAEGDCWDDPDVLETQHTAINGFAQPAADAVFPEATETWYDAIDQDCGGDGDFDQDGDGQNTDAWTDRTGGRGDDCDDTDGSVYDGASEVWYDGVDGDCSGGSDYDQDGDGHDSADDGPGDDCDDTRSDVNPSEPEDCSTGRDDDCSGATDDEDALGCTDYYLDADSDDYGVGSPECWCNPQTSDDLTALVDGDCDDSRATVNPGESEICDASDRDENCNGTADDDDGTTLSAGKTRYYPDDDDDSYGDSSSAGSLYCDDPSTSADPWSTNSDDCDDNRDDVNPSQTEICDAANTDEDCDGNADDDDSSASGRSDWYPDGDDDAYGDASASVTLRCDDPSSGSNDYVLDDNTDCDDTDPDVNPGASEVCDDDDTDEDCDGTADNDDSSASSATKTTFYRDTDGDGYGVGFGRARCDAQINEASVPGDCDDGDASVYPTAPDPTDGSLDDNDCDGYIDEDDVGEGTVVISEFFTAADEEWDWFEITNASGVDLDLTGWVIELCYISAGNVSDPVDADSCGITQEVTLSEWILPADASGVACADDTSFSPAACDHDYDYSLITDNDGLRQHNGGVALTLLGTLVDSVYWWRQSPGDDDWPSHTRNAIQLDPAWLLDPGAASINDDYTTDGSADDIWCETPSANDWSGGSSYFGTPGDPNEACP